MTAQAGELRILERQFSLFAAAMLAEAPLETVAACRLGWWSDAHGGVHLLWRDATVATADDYVRRGPAGAVIHPPFYAPIIKRCRTTREAFLLAHTHPFSRQPSFSGIDDGGEDQLIPKVRARVAGVPHGGLVLGRDGAAVRVWRNGYVGEPVGLMRVGCRGAGASARPGYERQDLALGPGTATALAGRHVAVVGTGGLGWVLGLTLWRQGVGRVTLVDPDRVEESNLSRLPGARAVDVGTAKVVVLDRVLRTMRSDGATDVISAPLADHAARAAVAGADVVVGATDNLGSRLDLDRFARRMLIPYVDCGINIDAGPDAVRRIGGRVNVSDPLGPCLLCMGVLTPDGLAAEAEPLGYRGVDRRKEAAVLAFNTVLAGLAAVEVLDLLLGFRGLPVASRYLVYDGLRGITREVAVPGAGRCGTCGDLAGAVFGQLP